MVNSSNGDLDLARECESNLSLQLTQKLRENIELASTYLLEPPTPRKSSSKPSLLYFWFMAFSDSTSPEKREFCREEEEGLAPRYLWLFFRGGWAHKPPLETYF